jgi:hypothetical protein
VRAFIDQHAMPIAIGLSFGLVDGLIVGLFSMGRSSRCRRATERLFPAPTRRQQPYQLDGCDTKVEVRRLLKDHGPVKLIWCWSHMFSGWSLTFCGVLVVSSGGQLLT